MKKIIKILNNHKWAIIFAFIAAVIIAYPQIYLRFDLGDSYQGIDTMGARDDEINWMYRMREVQDGHPTFSCVYLKDGKNAPYLLQPLGTIIFASLGKFFSLDINNTLLLSRSLFSFIVFLVIYAFIYLFSKKKLIALTAVTALTLGRDILNFGGIQNLISIGAPVTKYLQLTRPVGPAMTYFFLFGFLLFFWLFFERKQWRWGIMSAIFLGLSFYDYFYTWTFLYAFCGALIIILLLQKKWQDVKRVALVLLGAGLIAAPYFFNLYQVLVHPHFAEIAQSYGLVEGRVPVFGILAPLLFAVVLLFFPRQWKERYLFVLALAAAPLIALNQQIITGKDLSSVHYHWFYVWPLVIIFLPMTLLLWLYKKKWHFLKWSIIISVIFISISSSLLVQRASYEVNKKAIVERQKYGQVIDWLNQNAQKEEVVFTNDETANFLLIYTPLNVFYHFKASYCIVSSRQRSLDNLFLFYRLEGVDRENAREFFLQDRKHIFDSLYSTDSTAGESGISDEILLDLSQKYRDSLDMPTPEFINGLFSKYEVQYAVWDKKSNPKWQLDRFQFFEKISVINDFAIYRFNSI